MKWRKHRREEKDEDVLFTGTKDGRTNGGLTTRKGRSKKRRMVRGTVFGTRIGARKEGRQRGKENKRKRGRTIKRNRGYSRLRALGECVRRGNESMEKEALTGERGM